MSNTKVPSRIILSAIALVSVVLTLAGAWFVKVLFSEGYTVPAVLSALIVAGVGYVSFDNCRKAVATFKS